MKKKIKKILIAGGGTGGHFYPAIAVAESLNDLIEREQIPDVELYFMSDDPYDKELLQKTRLSYVGIMAGKRRNYFSLLNYIDLVKTFLGSLVALFQLFALYPDVIFGKGGYASFPAMLAARILRIPVVIHESDIIPGKVNSWIGSYATKIALSYPEAVKYFKHPERTALTGQPIRKELLEVPAEDPFQALGLEAGVPVILVIGGSLGAEKINENLLDIVPKLIERYQVIHQTGEKNIDLINYRSKELLENNPNAGRYRPRPFLESKELRLAAKAASLIISRAGSAIFEIALWGKPSILIPLPTARNDHQRENAYSYARTGAATVIEEQNLKPGLFLSVIASIMDDSEKYAKMTEGTKQFAKTDAAEKIAQALLSIAAQHD